MRKCPLKVIVNIGLERAANGRIDVQMTGKQGKQLADPYQLLVVGAVLFSQVNLWARHLVLEGEIQDILTTSHVIVIHWPL